MMYKLKNLIGRIVVIGFIWRLSKPLIKLSNFIQRRKKLMAHGINISKPVNREEIIEILKEPVVKYGPFKGLKYPHFYSFGSMLFPKIIGSYEKEIVPAIEDICTKQYADVIDIGSAEGYYSVGFAMNIPNATIHAYDVSKEAREFNLELAKLNGVEDRIEFNTFCSEAEITNFNYRGKTLIISDCEGYESKIFTKNNIDRLSNCDLLIEVHDNMNIRNSNDLWRLFEKTHNVQVIQSISDVNKVKMYSFPETEGLSFETKYNMFSEDRFGIMEWFYITPKQEKKQVVENEAMVKEQEKVAKLV